MLFLCAATFFILFRFLTQIIFTQFLKLQYIYAVQTMTRDPVQQLSKIIKIKFKLHICMGNGNLSLVIHFTLTLTCLLISYENNLHEKADI